MTQRSSKPGFCTQMPRIRMGFGLDPSDFKGPFLPPVPGCLSAAWEQGKSKEHRQVSQWKQPLPESWLVLWFMGRVRALPKGTFSKTNPFSGDQCIFLPLIMQQREDQMQLATGVSLASRMDEFRQNPLRVDTLYVSCGLVCHWPGNLSIWLSPEGQMSESGGRAIFPLHWPESQGGD